MRITLYDETAENQAQEISFSSEGQEPPSNWIRVTLGDKSIILETAELMSAIIAFDSYQTRKEMKEDENS